MVPLLSSLGISLGGLWSLGLIKKEFGIAFKLQSIHALKIRMVHGWYVFLSQLKISLFSNTNMVILGFIAGDKAVGYFAAAEKLIRSLASLQVPVTQALFPYISKDMKLDKQKAINQVSKVTKIGAIFYMIILLTIFIFSKEIILLVFGNDMIESVLVLKILLLIPLTIFLNNMFGTQILLNLGKDKIFFKILLSTALLNVVMVIPMTLFFGYIGTAVSVLISEIFLLIGMYIYARKEFTK
jgi:PST family polysaccharide transporter